MQALAGMQCSDGGWGWFSGFGEHSYPHTTAVVVLSAHDTPHHRLVAEKAGAAGYIAKADMEKQLEPTVRGLLRSRTRS